MNKTRQHYLLAGLLLLALAGPVLAKAQPIAIEDFIRAVCQHDQQFQVILSEALVQQYQAALAVPSDQLLLSAGANYHLNLMVNDEDESDASLQLEGLLAQTGTQVTASLNYGSDNILDQSITTASFSVAQPFLNNAFGHTHRLLTKVKGLEVELATYQVLEAYEDYLAQLMDLYYAWVAQWAQVEAERKILSQQERLLRNIQDRFQHKIADQLDVNKIKLQVLGSREVLLSREQDLQTLLKTIRRYTGWSGPLNKMPATILPYRPLPDSFETAFARVKVHSRSFAILNKIIEKNGLEARVWAEDLMPSAQLKLGLRTEGEKQLTDRRQEWRAGVEVRYDFLDQQPRLKQALAQAQKKQNTLKKEALEQHLQDQMESLFTAMTYGQKRLTLLDQQIALNEKVLAQEERHYLQGRAELNDVISASRELADNRFAKIDLAMQVNRLLIEWLRLTDQLVTKNKLSDLPG